MQSDDYQALFPHQTSFCYLQGLLKLHKRVWLIVITLLYVHIMLSCFLLHVSLSCIKTNYPFRFFYKRKQWVFKSGIKVVPCKGVCFRYKKCPTNYRLYKNILHRQQSCLISNDYIILDFESLQLRCEMSFFGERKDVEETTLQR